MILEAVNTEIGKILKWTRIMEEYMEMVGIKYEEIEEWSNERIKKALKKWDSEEWSREMEELLTLKIYRKYNEKGSRK